MMETMQRKATQHPGAAPTPRAPALRPAPAKRSGSRDATASRESVAAVVVPAGGGFATGRVVPVERSATFVPPPGFALAGFLHADGSAVKFAGAAGAIYLDPDEARVEFGALDARATTIQLSKKSKVSPQPIQPLGVDVGTFSVPAGFGLRSSGGQPLPPAVRDRMERVHETNFGDVRVHVGNEATAIGALAFTRGNDLYFAPGRYGPGTPSGDRLIGHELSHVVQQREGRVRNPGGSKPAVVADTTLEGEAERMGGLSAQADTATVGTSRNRSTGQSLNAPSAGAAIQRHINWDAGQQQFVVDNARPGWMDGINAIPVAPGQTLNHIIDFENIQNDLAILLNALRVNYNNSNVARVIAITRAIISPLNPAFPAMELVRDQLLLSIHNGAVANYHQESRALLSRLNSSTDNVRAGDQHLNVVIGQNIDADFAPGVHVFQGIARTQANWNGVPIGPIQVLHLTPHANQIVYRYQMATTQWLTFVISPITQLQLSSGIGPLNGVGIAAPLPVLVTNVGAAGLPILFQ